MGWVDGGETGVKKRRVEPRDRAEALFARPEQFNAGKKRHTLAIIPVSSRAKTQRVLTT